MSYESSEKLKSLTKTFKVLANLRRLQILRYLMEEHELTVLELSERIKLSYKSTSKHVVQLERAGFIKFRPVALHSYYSIAETTGAKQYLLELIKEEKH